MSNARVKIDLNEIPEGTITSPLLGMDPYVLIRIADVADDTLSLDVRVGGGVPAGTYEVGEFLTMVGDLFGQANVIYADDEAAGDVAEG